MAGAFRSADGLFSSPTTVTPIYNLTMQCRPGTSPCTFTTTAAGPTCTHENDVGVFCPAAENATVCTTGDMRLAGDAAAQEISREGRVEICLNNRWGTICDDSWDERSINFVCNSLFNTSSESGVICIYLHR